MATEGTFANCETLATKLRLGQLCESQCEWLSSSRWRYCLWHVSSGLRGHLHRSRVRSLCRRQSISHHCKELALAVRKLGL